MQTLNLSNKIRITNKNIYAFKKVVIRKYKIALCKLFPLIKGSEESRFNILHIYSLTLLCYPLFSGTPLNIKLLQTYSLELKTDQCTVSFPKNAEI
jgi:hypothetical protein